MNIVVGFEKYIPKPNIYLGYIEIMNLMKEIKGMKPEIRDEDSIYNNGNIMCS